MCISRKLLHDSLTTYMWPRKDPTNEYKLTLTTLVQEGIRLGVLSKLEGEFVIPNAPDIPVFYHLPKTHKGFNPLVGKLMEAGIQALTEQAGQWIDFQLHPLVTKLPSYLRDTKHLLNFCQDFE